MISGRSESAVLCGVRPDPTGRLVSTEGRRNKAETSAGRAGGYCWMEHPDEGLHCTRRPHADPHHVNYYRGRTSPTASHGIEWVD